MYITIVSALFSRSDECLERTRTWSFAATFSPELYILILIYTSLHLFGVEWMNCVSGRIHRYLVDNYTIRNKFSVNFILKCTIEEWSIAEMTEIYSCSVIFCSVHLFQTWHLFQITIVRRHTFRQPIEFLQTYRSSAVVSNDKAKQ